MNTYKIPSRATIAYAALLCFTACDNIPDKESDIINQNKATQATNLNWDFSQKGDIIKYRYVQIGKLYGDASIDITRIESELWLESSGNGSASASFHQVRVYFNDEKSLEIDMVALGVIDESGNVLPDNEFESKKITEVAYIEMLLRMPVALHEKKDIDRSELDYGITKFNGIREIAKVRCVATDLNVSDKQKLIYTARYKYECKHPCSNDNNINPWFLMSGVGTLDFFGNQRAIKRREISLELNIDNGDSFPISSMRRIKCAHESVLEIIPES